MDVFESPCLKTPAKSSLNMIASSIIGEDFGSEALHSPEEAIGLNPESAILPQTSHAESSTRKLLFGSHDIEKLFSL